jgi:archaemetzincin
MKITLKPIGEIDKHLLEDLQGVLVRVFGCPVEIAAHLDIAKRAYTKGRGQYRASSMLDSMKASGVAPEEKVLGIADVDLYAPERAELNFVFGQAEPGSGVAVISLSRLRQELPPDPQLFLKRAAKEAVHELGHTFGLGHCTKNKCVMHFSNTLHDTDVKEMTFCSQCHPKLIQ